MWNYGNNWHAPHPHNISPFKIHPLCLWANYKRTFLGLFSKCSCWEAFPSVFRLGRIPGHMLKGNFSLLGNYAQRNIFKYWQVEAILEFSKRKNPPDTPYNYIMRRMKVQIELGIALSSASTGNKIFIGNY